MALSGQVRRSWYVRVLCGGLWYGQAGRSGFVMVRNGVVVFGGRGGVACGRLRKGKAVQVGCGGVWFGPVWRFWYGLLRSGAAMSGLTVMVRSGAQWHGGLRSGWAVNMKGKGNGIC